MSEKETNMFLEQEQDPIDKTIVTRKMSEYAINDAINPEIEQNSIEQGSKYGEILYDKSLVFHGIGFDLIKLHSILENGILSEQAAQSKGVELIRNNDGFNLNDSVSVVESPSINNTFTFGCFESYIKSGISFVIENGEPYKATAGSSRDSSFFRRVIY